MNENTPEALQDPRANASLLLVEIGNSHVSVATAVGDQLYTHERFDIGALDAAVAHAHTAWSALPEDRRRAAIGVSVVPDVLADLSERLAAAIDTPLLVIGRDIRLPLPVALEKPDTLGVDRVCSAAAAFDVIGGPCAVASFGTAITIDCVNEEGVFMGGAILPGLRLQARALSTGTAALPEAPIEDIDAVYGSNTQEAIQSGILYGVVGGLREITERYATELRTWPQLVLTGGNADLVRRHCDFVDNVVDDLCLRGMLLAYRRHFAPLSD